MLEEIRKPLFHVALMLFIVIVLVELGSAAFLAPENWGGIDLPTPGLGIMSLSLLDGLLLFSAALIGVSLLVPERVHGRVQGAATFVVSLLILLSSIYMIYLASTMLSLMVALLLAVPLGSLIYLEKYGEFMLERSLVILTLLMSLKLAFGILLYFAHPRFLENKGLVLIVLTSLLSQLIISCFQGFPPGFLISITDAVGAIVVGILAAIWALIILIGSVPAVVKAMRVDRVLQSK